MPEAQAESKLREYNNYTLKWLTLHEALPGTTFRPNTPTTSSRNRGAFCGRSLGTARTSKVGRSTARK